MVHPVANSAVNTDDLAAVTRLDMVDEVFVGAKMNGLRRLALRHRVRRLLHLDVLLVSKHALVVDHLESVAVLALVAEVGLSNLTALNEALLLMLALGAFEDGFLHLRNSVTSANDDTLEADELVDVGGIELADHERLAQVVGSHLNDLVGLLRRAIHVRCLNAAMLKARLAEHVIFEHTQRHEIEDGNDISGVINELLIQLLVELEDVLAVYVEIVFFSLRNLFQKRDVVRCVVVLGVQVILVVEHHHAGTARLFESLEELAQVTLQLRRVDARTPKHLRHRRKLALTRLHIAVELRAGQVRRVDRTSTRSHARLQQTYHVNLTQLIVTYHIAELRSMQQSVGVKEAAMAHKVRHLAGRVEHSTRIEKKNRVNERLNRLAKP